MSFTVSLRLERAERSLERVIGVAGRRGYELVGVQAALAADGAYLEVELTLESERAADLIVRQLRRLHEVVFITCTPFEETT